MDAKMISEVRKRMSNHVLFHFNEFIFASSDANFLCMLQLRSPVGGRLRIGEIVVAIMFFAAKRTVWNDRLCIDGIDACLVKRNRVKRREHADVWDDGCIIFAVAVAVW